MGGIAALARASGHRVTGSDQNVYPPMSEQLAALGIELIEGYDPQQLQLRPDVVVVGNVMSRGNALVEALLDSGIPYTSGPEWLARHRGPCVLMNQATPRILDLYRKLGYEVHLLDAPRRISCNGDRTPAREVLALRNV